MALYTVSTGGTIFAQDINQLVNVLQRATGQTEQGGYHILESVYWVSGPNGYASTWISSLSRNSTPVSVSIDTSLLVPTNMNTPTTSYLGTIGFMVSGVVGSTTNAAQCGGLYTIQY